jgi:hypothetical protein
MQDVAGNINVSFLNCQQYTNSVEIENSVTIYTYEYVRSNERGNKMVNIPILYMKVYLKCVHYFKNDLL